MLTEDELDQADVEAIERHDRHDAYAGNALVAEKLWGALRGLGVDRGRMLVIGDHAAVHAGILTTSDTSTSNYEEWVAAIPPADREGKYPWPHDMIRPREFTDTAPPQHDVTIAHLPFSDLHLRSERVKVQLLKIQHRDIDRSIARTFPGGVIAVIASRNVLDNPDPVHRELFLADADFLGAVRLPGSAFRPELDVQHAEASDLLLWRRRLPGEPLRSAEVLGRTPVPVPGGVEYVNEYFGFTYPEHVAGTVGVVADADGEGTRYTVRCDDEPFGVVLRAVLSRIVSQARTSGLTAVSASWQPPDSRLAPEADWPRRTPPSSGTPSPGL